MRKLSLLTGLASFAFSGLALAQPEPAPAPPSDAPVAAEPSAAEPTQPPAPPSAPTPAPAPAPPPAPVVTTPPPPPPATSGAHTHDGFYMRLGTGLGAYSESLRSESTDLYGGKVQGNTTGIATLGEFAVGGNIGKGLVLGCGIYSAELIASTFRVSKSSDGSPPSELDPGVRNLALIGPFLDWYPNPKKGFHLQVALGFAALTGVSVDTNVDREDVYHAEGGGIMLGAGYEWWIGDEWSLGVEARLLGTLLTGKDDSDVRWFHAAGTSPSPVFTVTYH